MLIKVCGMRDLENIRQLIRIKPDLIGLIFYPKSLRYVAAYEELLPVLGQRGSIGLTGVFVNEKPDIILALHRVMGFDYIQLHGHESQAMAASLREKNLKVIKAFGISQPADLRVTGEYSDCADLFLFDTRTSGHGGSGQKFDWRILDHYTGKTPFLLSGGIGPDDNFSFIHPQMAGVDLNSRFETAPGLKDIEKIKKFICKIKS